MYSSKLVLLVFWLIGGTFFSDGFSQNGSGKLYEAIENRGFQALWELKDHPDSLMASMALRAMIHAENIPSDVLFEAAAESNSIALWRVLGHQAVDSGLLHQLNDMLETDTGFVDGICTVLARQGNGESLRVLASKPRLIHSNAACSFALGYLAAGTEMPDDVFADYMGILAENSGGQAAIHLLYGLYRSGLNRPEPGSEFFGQLTNLLEQRQEPLTLADEYLARIAAPESIEIMLENRPIEDVYAHVQVGVELASAVSLADLNTTRPEFLEMLARHPNHHVRIGLLESLASKEQLPDFVFDVLTGFENSAEDDAETYIAWLHVLKENNRDLGTYENQLTGMLQTEPYLADQIFGLLADISAEEDYLQLLMSYGNNEGILALHSAAALSEYVNERELSEAESRQVHSVLLNAVESENRSFLSSGKDLFLDSRFFGDEDAANLADRYQQIAGEPDTGLATAIYAILQERNDFGQLSEPVRKPFRRPEQLFSGHDKPVWVLETEHGNIDIELEPNAAPYTVSSIIHLTEQGVYNGVILHRVVRNFVVQGGDFDRKDGFGGPEYRIPTEPGIHTFYKGSAGIASSGPDTEGSQFFITLTPTPHLDGNYTIFGNVISGMEVVENIQRGDQILRAYIR